MLDKIVGRYYHLIEMLIVTTFSLIVVFLTIFSILYTLKKVEYKYFPMLSDVHVYFIREDEPFAIYNIEFTKNRSCEVLTDKFAWYAKTKRGYNKRLNFDAPPVKGYATRPIGKNYSNGWRVDLNSPGITMESPQTLVFVHSCFPHLWETKSEISLVNGKVVSVNGIKQ